MEGKTPPALMCTLVNALVNQEKRPPAQVAAGVCAGCSNQIQVAQGQDLHYGGALVQAAFGCCIPHTHLLQLALVVFFLDSLAHLLMCT